MAKEIITQKRLKEALHYDPCAGIFINKITRGPRAIKGSVAGWVGTNGYIIINIDGLRYKSHRLAWLYITGKWPDNEIDHINHIVSDNRFINLRSATRAENNRNMPIQKNNTSGFTGVVWHKQANKWQAQISINRKNKSLGLFDIINDAIEAREKANIKYGFHHNHGV